MNSIWEVVETGFENVLRLFVARTVSEGIGEIGCGRKQNLFSN